MLPLVAVLPNPVANLFDCLDTSRCRPPANPCNALEDLIEFVEGIVLQTKRRNES